MQRTLAGFLQAPHIAGSSVVADIFDGTGIYGVYVSKHRASNLEEDLAIYATNKLTTKFAFAIAKQPDKQICENGGTRERRARLST